MQMSVPEKRRGRRKQVMRKRWNRVAQIEKEKKIWLVSAVLLAVTMIVLYAAHKGTPFMMDDLWYSTLLFEDTPISSFGDIIKSQIWHYYNWGGRSMAHGLLQLTLLAGEKAADIINLLMTLLLALMICAVSGNRKFPMFFAAVSLPLGLNANWRMSMFWQSGAANYLYITVFILAYVFCFLRELPEEVQSGGINAEVSERTCPRQLPGILFWIIPLGIFRHDGPAHLCHSVNLQEDPGKEG